MSIILLHTKKLDISSQRHGGESLYIKGGIWKSKLKVQGKWYWPRDGRGPRFRFSQPAPGLCSTGRLVEDQPDKFRYVRLDRIADPFPIPTWFDGNSCGCGIGGGQDLGRWRQYTRFRVIILHDVIRLKKRPAKPRQAGSELGCHSLETVDFDLQ